MTLDLQIMSDRIAIEECLYRYAHLVDAIQYDRIAEEVFTEDACIDFGGARVRWTRRHPCAVHGLSGRAAGLFAQCNQCDDRSK
ncbi:nuclear transport factor 2 family protein [Sphingobium aromaticiconvertens]|uniref:nuclear transport factor 2 family protein n=1 Tax=Sphingobium aromaticiconvertens TaxID=365341 RepID=UPI0030169138